jgi:ElaB/YqjD/DUF883 family membrane-anchored ribosome-binding protein
MAAQSQASSPMEGAKEQVQEQAQQAQQSARSRVREQVDQRSTQAGEQLRSSAQALRETSERLREQGQDGPARAAQRLAHHAERVGGYLKESDADRLLGDAEDFGRRRPLAVAGIGLFVGFAASRLLKASSRERYEQQRGRVQQPRAVTSGATGMTETGMATVPTQAEPPSVPVGAGRPGGPPHDGLS